MTRPKKLHWLSIDDVSYCAAVPSRGYFKSALKSENIPCNAKWKIKADGDFQELRAVTRRKELSTSFGIHSHAMLLLQECIIARWQKKSYIFMFISRRSRTRKGSRAIERERENFNL
jgi:hypothetical protein